MSFAPTAEQISALDLYATGASFAIEAGAGTGKTATLKLLAEADPNRRIQYVAFNKAIVVEAGEKMPGNVRCNTAHSIAFREVGKKFAHRLNGRRVRSIELARMLGTDPVVVTNFNDERRILSASFLAGQVMAGIVKFCQTADEEPDWFHVPIIEGLDEPRGEKKAGRGPANREVARALVQIMRRAWLDLRREDGRLPYRHDHYLKAYQLSGPRIHADVILFDEAQDANPVMQAIVAEQASPARVAAGTAAQIVWVGDSQQQIYSFTGAVNALDNIDADNRTFLTRSFRFGPAIAAEANRVLARLDAPLRLTGTDSIASEVVPVADPDVILCRTNAVAVRSVLLAQRAGTRVHLVGGGAEIVSFARAAERLIDGEKVDHPELACFDSWGEVQEYVQQDALGGELRLLVGLIDEFGVPAILEALDRMAPEASADLVVSTAHKAKGREWGSVRLADDFPEAPEAEELRLLYVAVTRAKRQLDVGAVLILAEPDVAEETPAPAGVPSPEERALAAGPEAGVDLLGPVDFTTGIFEIRRGLDGQGDVGRALDQRAVAARDRAPRRLPHQRAGRRPRLALASDRRPAWSLADHAGRDLRGRSLPRPRAGPGDRLMPGLRWIVLVQTFDFDGTTSSRVYGPWRSEERADRFAASLQARIGVSERRQGEGAFDYSGRTPTVERRLVREPRVGDVVRWAISGWEES